MKNRSFKNFVIILFVLLSSQLKAQNDKQVFHFSMSINDKVRELILTKDELIKSIIGVQIYQNSEFAERVTLNGFTFKCPDKKAIVIKGDKLTDEAIRCIKLTKIGNFITLYDPKFQIDGILINNPVRQHITIELK